MVSLCSQFRPSELRRLGRHLLELVAPEIAEAEEAKRLENEEQRAREKTSLRSRLIGDGLARTTIVHPELDRDRLLTYLESYASPRKSTRCDQRGGGPDPAPPPPRPSLRRPAGAPRPHPAPRPRRGRHHADGHHRPGLPPTASSAPAPSSAANRSRPPRSAGWPAPQRSSPSSSAARARSSTSAAPAASSHPPNAKPWQLRDQRLPHRRLHDPRALVRSTSSETLVPRRQHRPRRRHPRLQLPPPPPPRPPLRPRTPPQRRHPLPPPQIAHDVARA